MSQAPDYILRDPDQITLESVQWLEQRLGRTLHPAQAERLMVDWLAWRETLVRERMQDAAALNLVQFSRGDALRELGKFHSIAPLPAVSASCDLQFTIPAALSSDLTIPAGTVVAGPGVMAVQTRAVATLPAGLTSVVVKADAIDPGPAGNGYIRGQLAALVTTITGAPPGMTVINITPTDGGDVEESDERFRQRLLAAPDKYSTAGSRGSYRFHALSAHPSIISVEVLSVTPGEVDIYVLTRTGDAPRPVLDAVAATCSAEDVRPLCDTVQVFSAVAKPYRVSGTVKLAKGYRVADLSDAINRAAADLSARWSATIGGDIVPSQIVAGLHAVPGVYRVDLVEPAAVVTLWPHEFRRCTDISLSIQEWS